MELNEWIIAFLIFCILVVAYRLGVYLGKRNAALKQEGHLGRVSNIQAGLMGLLGVMLAFSFSLSSQRYEKRRQLVIQESMNIGTAYFRAGLLPDPLKRDVRNLLEKYLDERINYYQPENSYENKSEFQKKSESLHVQIWAKTAEIGKKAPTLNTNITILALNDMIDISGNISSEFQSHVPQFILLLLVFISVCTILIMGYTDGLSSEKNIVFAIILNLVLCSILLLIIDMDRPTSGYLKSDTYGLTELKKEIQDYSPNSNVGKTP